TSRRYWDGSDLNGDAARAAAYPPPGNAMALPTSPSRGGGNRVCALRGRKDDSAEPNEQAIRRRRPVSALARPPGGLADRPVLLSRPGAGPRALPLCPRHPDRVERRHQLLSLGFDPAAEAVHRLCQLRKPA